MSGQDNPMLTERLVQAEQAVLGSMLIDSGIVGACLQKLGPEDFVTGKHLAVFRCLQKLYGERQPLDPVAVNDRLGGNYRDILVALMDNTPTSANWELYADILHKDAALYRMQELGAALSEAADMEAAMALADKISAVGCEKPSVRITSLRDCYQEFLDRHAEGKRPPYLTWGIQELDERVYIEPGDLVVLGGYPSAGKTALALQMAYHIARNKRVGYFYLENNDRKLFDRLVSAQTKVSFGKIKRYDLGEDDFSAIVSSQDRLIAPSLEFVDAAGMTAADVRAVALSLRLDVIAVDYLQKLRSGASARELSEYDRVTRISSDLQNLGRQTGITVLALSQLTRSTRKGGAPASPSMHNLRNSGQIEQDADVVMLLYKEFVDQPKGPRMLKLDKNKEGAANIAMRMYFDGDTQTFSRIHEAEAPPDKKWQAPRQVSFWDGWQELTADEKTPFDEGDV